MQCLEVSQYSAVRFVPAYLICFGLGPSRSGARCGPTAAKCCSSLAGPCLDSVKGQGRGNFRLYGFTEGGTWVPTSNSFPCLCLCLPMAFTEFQPHLRQQCNAAMPGNDAFGKSRHIGIVLAECEPGLFQLQNTCLIDWFLILLFDCGPSV